jgi:2-amino-4-hydroxy-6-hydroxymethyldihydropteridine diphosphokinase
MSLHRALPVTKGVEYPDVTPHMTPLAPAVFVALGTNLGDRERNLARGVAGLSERGLHITARSSVYETEPVGGPVQGPYLNAVVQADTALDAQGVLASCLEVERAVGRVRGLPNAPRTLDLDLLLYGALVLRTAQMSVPHPRMHERRFVLAPLLEIAPGVLHPVLGLTVAEMAAACPDQSAVGIYGPPGLLG